MYNVFAVLCVVPSGNAALGSDQVALLMNVLEMLMALLFRSLPVESLRQWLPDGEREKGSGLVVSRERRTSREGVVGGLNIACPLDQGVNGMKERPFVDLKDEEDGLIQEWLREMERERYRRNEVSRIEDLEKVLEKVDREDAEIRKKAYAEKARRYNRYIEQDGVFLPNWLVLGAAAVVVGWMLFRGNGGPRR